MTPYPEHRFAAYPLVETAAATGRVAAVYADALTRLPFVPSLLKSLAVCPPYLVLAWRQAAPMLDSPELSDAAHALATGARPDGAALDVPAAAAATMREFRAPLARMLLLACGLHAAVAGRIDGPPAPLEPPPDPAEAPTDDAPSAFDTDDTETYGRIRAALATPLVNTIWRRLAVDGHLPDAWRVLEPAATATRQHADTVRHRAVAQAGALPWSPVASPAALASAGIPDAAAGMAAVLQAYVTTLPRVLTLAAAVGDPAD